MTSSAPAGCCFPRLLQQRRQQEEVLPPTALQEPLQNVSSSGPAMVRQPRRRSRRTLEAGSWRLPAACCLLGLLTASSRLLPVEGAGTVVFEIGTKVDLDAEDVVVIFAADLDGDGDLDLLAGSYWEDWVRWYENEDGKGTFSEAVAVASGYGGASSIDVGDLNGDGSPDVVVAFLTSFQLTWFSNVDGLGDFSVGTDIDTYEDGDHARYVTVADLDGDGDLDVIMASKQGDRVTWYENTDGEATFALGVDISTTADGAIALALADLDGDDDLDVLSASVFSGLAWYENSNGSGAFSLGVSLEPADPAGGKDVVTADIDGDGDMDIISASFDGNHTAGNFPDGRILWLENDGSGSFAEGRDIGLLDSARNVVAVDLDNDGDVDLVACDGVGGHIVWYDNMDGKGNFSEAIDIAIDVGVHSLIAVDLDGDGDIDIATATRDDAEVVWYENLLIEIDDDDGGSDATGTTATPAPTPAVTPSPDDVTSETRTTSGRVERRR
ncbi:unnamed protein product, partial [Ectocarpus sp. 12 AP-2014]